METEAQTKKFSIPVDQENKATVFPLFSFASPHMRSFHLTWVTFFSCFVSTFAAPPLLPIIRDNLGLKSTEIANAGVASVSGAVFARVAMGTACDLFGPRLASSTVVLITAPAVFLTSIADSATSYLLVRFFTGFSLATFVSTQYWMSSMFSGPVVGTANGVAAGWGNLGGGATQLIMPLVFGLIRDIGITKFTAWRVAFFIPAIFQVLTAIAVMLFGQDLPDGNFNQLKVAGKKQEDDATTVLINGVSNYRAWILALGYGYCFGVELTTDNIIAEYYYDRFNLKLNTAGLIAASFGLANLFSRPLGGLLSDMASKRFGMRGRLWALWIMQTLGGVFCILLGKVSSLGASVAMMIIFSLFCQAACGLTFGVVPFVSRRSLGVVSGMTGAGGNVGAVLTQLIFFRGSKYSTEMGIVLMGVMIIACSLPLCFIYFPMWGWMFSGPLAGKTTEEEYYMSEWSEKDKERGLHEASLMFAKTSVKERGRKGGQTETYPANETPQPYRD